MSNGSAGIGTVPITVCLPESVQAGRLSVAEFWTSAENGVELRAWTGRTPVSAFMNMSTEEAVLLAGLLLRASQPANVEGNGYEKWVKAAREVIEDAFDPAQGWDYSDHAAEARHRAAYAEPGPVVQ
jgi:hypothetical protein